MNIRSLCEAAASGLLAAAICSTLPANAVTLNFSANLLQASCDISLDKSAVFLGPVVLNLLNNGRAVENSQRVTLMLRNCNGDAGGALTPAIKVTGEGVSTLDGKWLFRSSGSAGGGAGVLLTPGSNVPDYSQQEVKNGDYINVGAAGAVPAEQDLHFMVSASCGDAASCRQNPATEGQLNARILFDFTYY